ncbi:MAG TPA: hypothetical protein VH866_01850 [Candidatus Deferrimicrobiaceae bacterium]|jgi:hypothetical protein
MKGRLSVAVLLGLAVAVSGFPAEALDCNSPPSSWGDTGAYESWCRACGGTVSGSGPRIQCIRGPNWGRKAGGPAGGGAGAGGALYGGFYSLGYAFGQWLVGGGSDPQQEARRREMMEELQRRQAEAERLHREEEARRLAGIYNRLSSTLKLSGTPDLKLKGAPGGASGLKLKTGDGAGGGGIAGLPGIYLNGGDKPYGVPGLPGIYTGGPGQGSGLSGSALKLKIGGEAAAAAPTSPTPNAAPAPPTAQAAPFDPESMTPQQLADVAEMFGRLPPEEQARLMDVMQKDAGAPPPPPETAGPTVPGLSGPLPADAPAPLQQQAVASQAAASAPAPEDASDQARAGFDRPLGSAPPVLLETPRTTPSIPPTPIGGLDADSIARGGLPYIPKPPARSFPKNPGPQLLNPLREEQRVQAELKAWDDWAVQRATSIFDKPEDPLYPASMERAILNTDAVKEYAPELLARYESDPSFRQRVDLRLRYATEVAALDYYQLQADAHKAAVLSYQAELEKLAAAGSLDRLVPLEEQLRLHPERRQLVQAVRERISAEEEAALEKAWAAGGARLREEFQYVFRLIRGEASRKHENESIR